MSAPPTNRVERLATAAVIAPTLREMRPRTASRRVACVNPEGQITRYTTLAELQDALLARHKIEIDTQPGVRPREFICEKCGLPSPQREFGPVAKFCGKCLHPACLDCGVSIRNGGYQGAVRCVSCGHEARRRSPIARCADCGAPTTQNENALRSRGVTSARCLDCHRKATATPVHLCGRCSKRLSLAPKRAHALKREGGSALCRACLLASRRLAPRSCENCGSQIDRGAKRICAACYRTRLPR